MDVPGRSRLLRFIAYPWFVKNGTRQWKINICSSHCHSYQNTERDGLQIALCRFNNSWTIRLRQIASSTVILSTLGFPTAYILILSQISTTKFCKVFHSELAAIWAGSWCTSPRSQQQWVRTTVPMGRFSAWGHTGVDTWSRHRKLEFVSMIFPGDRIRNREEDGNGAYIAEHSAP